MQLQRKKGVALASLALGICAFPFLGFYGFMSPVGIVLGVIALVRVRNRPEEYGGKAIAIVGMAVNTISLILAIAFLLPPLFTSSLARNETSAVSSLLSIYKAEQSFRSTNSLRAYGVLRELSSAGLIETALGSGIKGGYQFEVRLEADSFEAVATPVIYGSRWDFKRTGIRSFYINQSGIIRDADRGGSEATASDTPID